MVNKNLKILSYIIVYINVYSYSAPSQVAKRCTKSSVKALFSCKSTRCNGYINQWECTFLQKITEVQMEKFIKTDDLNHFIYINPPWTQYWKLTQFLPLKLWSQNTGGFQSAQCQSCKFWKPVLTPTPSPSVTDQSKENRGFSQTATCAHWLLRQWFVQHTAGLATPRLSSLRAWLPSF